MAVVDVVIPAYERPELLAEAVRSVQAQTFADWRLYIVDDASPISFAAAGYEHDPRISVIRLSHNCGPAIARNTGAFQGNSPFIAFLDSDDLWAHQKLALQVAEFEKDERLEWLHTNELWLRNGEKVKQKAIHRKQAGKFFERALERCLISPSAVMLRRRFFVAEGGFATAFRLCEDYELWLRLLLKAPIGYLKEPLTVKRAGEWPQLSSAREIDRYRVLAMHRVFRLNRLQLSPEDMSFLLAEAHRKCSLLISGAEKYGNLSRLKRYQAWLILFKTLRTRPMR